MTMMARLASHVEVELLMRRIMCSDTARLVAEYFRKPPYIEPWNLWTTVIHVSDKIYPHKHLRHWHETRMTISGPVTLTHRKPGSCFMVRTELDYPIAGPPKADIPIWCGAAFVLGPGHKFQDTFNPQKPELAFDDGLRQFATRLAWERDTKWRTYPRDEPPWQWDGMLIPSVPNDHGVVLVPLHGPVEVIVMFADIDPGILEAVAHIIIGHGLGWMFQDLSGRFGNIRFMMSN